MTVVDNVIKVGGGVLAHPEYFAAVLTAIAEASRGGRTLIVPGGGPFADAVRDVDRRFLLSDDAAHWMAVLAMDQYAHLLASKLPGSVIVAGLGEIEAALEQKRLPVLAPSRWLREADPLPHSWAVTSDSIAAWVAAQAGAKKLVLIKPPGVRCLLSVDEYFARAISTDITPAIIPADRLEILHAALQSARPAAVS